MIIKLDGVQIRNLSKGYEMVKGEFVMDANGNARPKGQNSFPGSIPHAIRNAIIYMTENKFDENEVITMKQYLDTFKQVSNEVNTMLDNQLNLDKLKEM